MGMSGGGGGDDYAAQEAERQRKIEETINKINGIYDNAGRDQLYSEHRTNVLDLNKSELDRQRDEAERVLKFALARSGHAGGQVDVSGNEDLLRRYQDGLLRINETADTAAERLRQSDEKSRLNLISQAQTGLDTTTAAQNALRSLDVNARDAQATNQVASLGDIFAGLADAYAGARYTAGQQSARLPYGNSTSSRAPASAGKTEQGTIY